MELRPESWIFGLLIAGIAGSYPADGMDIRILCLLRVVQIAASVTG